LGTGFYGSNDPTNSVNALKRNTPEIFAGDESAGVVFAGWLVIGVSGKVLSPNALAGVGRSKLSR